jgi:hypothetical protein
VNNGPKAFAPETGIGTGAAEPLHDEVELAKEVPSVDESTAGKGKNYPGNEGDAGNALEYSLKEPAYTDLKSTGEDYETRNVDNDDVPLAGNAVDPDAEPNQKAEDVRPEVPQSTVREQRSARKGGRSDEPQHGGPNGEE